MSNTFQIQSNDISSKQLPHNMEAEQGLLGAILINNEISNALKNSKFTDMRFDLINKNTFKQYSLDNYNKSISKYINNSYINNLIFMN